MSLTALLEIAIALVLLYLLFSQITLSIVELLAGILNTRGKFLYDRLVEALGKTSTESIYASASIKALYRSAVASSNSAAASTPGRAESPTYISAAVFAQAVVALSAPNPAPANATPILEQGPASLRVFIDTTTFPQEESLYKLLKTQLQDAAITGNKDAEAQKLTQNLVDWYSDFQQRLTGRYKRQLRLPLLGAGLGVAIFFNVDTLAIIKYLRTHPADRQQALTLATQFVKDHPDGVSEMIPGFGGARGKSDSAAIRQRLITRYTDSLVTRLQQQGMPLGWWRIVPLDTMASTESGKPVNEVFYLPKPGGYLLKLPAKAQVFDTEKAHQTLAKIRKLLATNKLSDSAAYRDELLLVEKAYKEAELAQKPPIDEAKFIAAETSTQKALNTVAYLAAHHRPAADDAQVLLKEYRALLAQLQKARPVRWSYPPFYVQTQWQRDTQQALASTTNVRLTHREWQRTLLDPTNVTPPVKYLNLPVLDGQPRFTLAAFNGVWSVVSWLLTALAMMVGAPFWFDLLSRFVNIRNVGIKPDEAGK